jgi:ADP-ribosyl-[dinitrogen reductase] hydrolase
MEKRKQQMMSAVIGSAIGDALGVPVEFKSRAYLKENPVTDMIGYGTHNQPAGSWSDDTSFTLCLAEALKQPEFSLEFLGSLFVRWMNEGYLTANGKMFDIGISTQQAILNIEAGVPITDCGGRDFGSNGNGSLMRILPLAFHITDMPIDERFRLTKDVSSITHGHIYSVTGCFIYLEIARELILGKSLHDAYELGVGTSKDYLLNLGLFDELNGVYDRVLDKAIPDLVEDEISSSGFVVHTLEAALWCLFTSSSYKETVLKAVNLGDDTDTTAAVVGGLAVMVYGANEIPRKWRRIVGSTSLHGSV